MSTKQVCPVRSSAWVGLLLLAALGAPPTAHANGPMLSIRLTGGQQTIYAIGDVQRMGFEGDTLVVVATGGSDRYAAESVTKIEFLMEVSGIHDPREAAALVHVMHLFQNQPNPFSPETKIAFDLPHSGPVELRIYSADGRLIRRLVKDERQAGQHTASWDGRNDAGEKVGSGIYFYQLTAPGVEESRRMVLLP